MYLGVLDLAKEHKEQMKILFTPIGNSAVTNDQFFDLLLPNYSNSTQSKDKEINTFKAMCDFNQELFFGGKFYINIYIPYSVLI